MAEDRDDYDDGVDTSACDPVTRATYHAVRRLEKAVLGPRDNPRLGLLIRVGDLEKIEQERAESSKSIRGSVWAAAIAAVFSGIGALVAWGRNAGQ